MQVWMYGHAYGLDLTVRNKVCIIKNENAKLERYFTSNKRINQVLSQQPLWALCIDLAHTPTVTRPFVSLSQDQAVKHGMQLLCPLCF